MVTPKDTLRVLLHSYVHCAEEIQIPPAAGSVTPPNSVDPFFACWFMGIRRPKEQISFFQLNGMFAVPQAGALPCLEPQLLCL